MSTSTPSGPLPTNPDAASPVAEVPPAIGPPVIGPLVVGPLVVGIGASAGGIEAFREFFANMPPNSGVAFVVVLHLPPDRTSVLPEILGRWTVMPIIQVADACRVAANTIYLPSPGCVITYRDGSLHTQRPTETREYHPINLLFDSLAAELREDAVGIVLSGTGSDGALGLKAIKAAGGLTLVQGSDGTGPQQEGMPASAIATGAVDVIAPAHALPGHIMAMLALREQPDAPATLPPEQTNAARLAICAILQRDVGHDFSGYKDKTFLRRVQRRMQVTGCTTLDDFISRLQQDRGEVRLLFRDLLIGVTSFFRDAETFAALNRLVIPRLFEGRHAGDTIRVWVPGCATGEEAYSLAILLREYADSQPEPPPTILVFATDIDEAAIAAARIGRYLPSLLHGIEPERLRRFFIENSDGSYALAKSVREMCNFSAHSLTRDPPFSRINLISCRNLLIYLDSDLQATVIPAFHYSLAADGILLLGSSETISRQPDLFAPLDRSHRIFQKRDVRTPPLHLSGQLANVVQSSLGRSPTMTVTALPGISSMSNWADRRILERFAPAFVVVTADGNCVQFSNRVGRFLSLAPGAPSQNVMVMAPGGLRPHLRACLKLAVETGRIAEQRCPALAVGDNVTAPITLTIEPRPEGGADTLYLVVFNETAEPPDRVKADQPDMVTEDGGAERQLEVELRDTREQLQSITEEHETALEELRSANEELHSVNEELQSTNEELETSKEEIQSINEELQTVNSELAAKVDELDHRNSDMKNLFESTQVATVFLDQHLVIRSFTPPLASIYNLIPSDVGRPLTDIVSRLRDSDVRQDCAQVLNTLKPLERRVVRDDGSTHYLMRILPYRAPNSTVDGTIVTFVDVTSIVQAEQHQRLLVDELNHRVKNMLTVVTSLASQTMHRATSMEEFMANYMGRIDALAAAYSLLSNEGWQTVSLRDLLSEEFKPFLAPDSSNFELSGPLVLLAPRQALSLGLAVHELVTNALKYGALSCPGGKVTVAWDIENGQHGNWLVLTWTEHGGPAVVPPQKRGFGSILIERGLKQDMLAEVNIEFAADGLRVHVRAPLRSSGAATPRALQN